MHQLAELYCLCEHWRSLIFATAEAEVAADRAKASLEPILAGLVLNYSKTPL